MAYTDELIRQAQSIVRNFREVFPTAYPESRGVKIKEMDITFHTISNSDNELSLLLTFNAMYFFFKSSLFLVHVK